MHRPILALLAAVTVLTVPTVVNAAGGNQNTPTSDATPLPPASLAAPCSSSTQIDAAYSDKNWRQADPQLDPPCQGLERYAAKMRQRHHRWHVYRQIVGSSPGAPAGGYPGCSGGGRWLRYTAIPGSVVERESGCSWTSYNSSSGACSAYQFIGWTSCDASSWQDKMRLHRTAAYVLRVQGPGAWSAW